MTMKHDGSSLTQVRNDHQHWQKRTRRWREDISEWCDQHQTVLESLERIANAIREMQAKTQDHMNDLESISTNIESQDREFSHPDFQTSAEVDNHNLARHRDLATKMDDFDADHERRKRNHFTLIGQIMVLRAVVEIEN